MNSETSVSQAVETPAAPARKWTSEAGPIQTKKVNAALKDIAQEGQTHTEKWGVIGAEMESNLWSPFSPVRKEAVEAQTKIAEQFNYTVTRANYQQIIEAVRLALVELRKLRPVDDKRRTADQDAEQRQAMRQADEDRENRAAEKMKPFLAAFGQGTEINADRMAVCAVLTYDDSDLMSDYHNSHATIGCPLVLGLSADKRTEASARYFVSLYPELRGIEFEWHTENYSGGHGNYLREKEVHDLPESISGLLPEGLLRGRWEIQFNRWQKSLQAFKGYPGTFEGQNTPSSLPQDERSSSGAGGVVVRRNTEHNGVEIRFPGKPERSKIDECKAAGFHWSRHSGVWYKRYGANAWAAAHRIAGIELPAVTSHVATAEDRAKDPYLSADSIVHTDDLATKAAAYNEQAAVARQAFPSEAKAIVDVAAFSCPKGYGECEDARTCVYPGRCGVRHTETPDVHDMREEDRMAEQCGLTEPGM